MSPPPSMFGQPYYMGDIYVCLAGFSLGLSVLNFFALFYQYGYSFTNRTSVLQLVNGITGILLTLDGIQTEVFPQDSCNWVIAGLPLYIIAEMSVDGVLVVRILATYANRSKIIRTSWIIMFLLLDMGARIVHVSLNEYTYIPSVRLCHITSNSASALIQDISVCTFMLAMGLEFARNLWHLKDLKDVAMKSAVFTLLLIICKFSLYIPYSQNVIS
ncbi:hypothetical protein HDU91_005411, partial [Kappamyces sp. JEL0680]